MEELDTDQPSTLWFRFKCWLFMKLGHDLWKYVILHSDYWKKPYGVSFTERDDFLKKFKYDMAEMPDSLDEAIEEHRKKNEPDSTKTT